VSEPLQFPAERIRGRIVKQKIWDVLENSDNADQKLAAIKEISDQHSIDKEEK